MHILIFCSFECKYRNFKNLQLKNVSKNIGQSSNICSFTKKITSFGNVVTYVLTFAPYI